MGSSGPALQSPDLTAGVQQQYNSEDALASLAGSEPNQVNPYGSISSTITGYENIPGVGEIPQYSQSTALSPAEQELLGLQQAGGAEANLGAASLLNGAYTGANANPNTAIGNETSGLMGQAEQQFQSYEQPFFTQQTNALENQLQNQGLTYTDPAYQTAMNNLAQSQGQTTSGFLSEMEPQAFNQAQSLYTMPAQLAGSLQSEPGATVQTPSEINYPTLNIAAPNYEGDVSSYDTAEVQEYQAQQSLLGNVFSGLGQLGLAGAKLYTSSDRRLKRDIQRIGSLFGLCGIYRYRMRGNWHIGLMADEVQRFAPEAVRLLWPQFEHVDYLGVNYPLAIARACQLAGAA
jgi:hypothetical protein